MSGEHSAMDLGFRGVLLGGNSLVSKQLVIRDIVAWSGNLRGVIPPWYAVGNMEATECHLTIYPETPNGLFGFSQVLAWEGNPAEALWDAMCVES